ncbi:MAG: tRNA (adenosine(37)-N6)-dimethylallyltransferase MiaA [Deltaproteobacteria bacterium]|nr:tRNA (adenosine(37)-N6)-dimethylallyltransferase MiaA [Deltaproteobacteria bacterium]
MKSPYVIAITGPTASGKSAVALSVSQKYCGEIINCDSVQVYRDFNIGCAKPTPDELSLVKHHLLDVVNWNESFDAQHYRNLAIKAIADINARQGLAIICGGTGLYLRALRWGLLAAPPAQEELRASLYQQEEQNPGEIYKRLQSCDPKSAKQIGPKNIVHLLRALEITLLAGEPASQLRAQHGFAREEVPMMVIALTWPLPMLRTRIKDRVEVMLNAGLITEVEGLLNKGVSVNSRPMRSVGYKEVSETLLGLAPLKGLSERIVKATYTYARRQLTWLRKEREVKWIEVQSLDQANSVVMALLSSYKS